jgi:restriction system protein
MGHGRSRCPLHPLPATRTRSSRGWDRRRVRGEVFPLLDDFDGNLLYYPEIIPVTLNFGRVLAETSRNPEELLRLGPRQFEELVAEIWKRFGYLVELTSRTRDGGRDIIAVKQLEANIRFLIECKRYATRNKVGVGIVRELYGVKTDEKATKAILATTSSFTKGAKDFFSRHVWELEPRDFDGVVEWVTLAVKQGSM